MTKQDKIDFVRSLCASIRDELVEKIEADKTPDEWDGHELREWLADKFNESRSSLMRSNYTRRNEYQNTVLISNL